MFGKATGETFMAPPYTAASAWSSVTERCEMPKARTIALLSKNRQPLANNSFGDENVEAERRASQRAGAESSDDVVAFGREEIAVEWPRDAGAGGEASAAQDLARVKPGL